MQNTKKKCIYIKKKRKDDERKRQWKRKTNYISCGRLLKYTPIGGL